MVWRAYLKILIICVILYWTCTGHAGTIVITDKLGRAVTVKVPVKRAVDLIMYELVPALDIWGEVIGVSRWAEENCGVYKAIVYKKPSLKKRGVGAASDLNFEELISLNPDVIITWSFNRATVSFLEKKRFKVIAVWPESLEELYEVMRMYGKLFGKEKRVEFVIGEMDKLFKLIQERVKKIPHNQVKKVLHLGGTPNRVSAAQTVINNIIKIIGGTNPAEAINQRYIDVSAEKIVSWNPDVIFIWGSARYDEATLYNNSQLRSVKAVKERKVYKLPRWSTWSPRLAIIALYMAMKVYPEIFNDLSFEKVADEFYKKVFNVSFREVVNFEGY
ncbi:MAG: ABC transporter substrate-binding protein [Caldimicrobium sp.]